ncbi:MAG: hypothetical protein DWQ02_16605 [Bacteroidetes bacterium]|nr:MAG: hypothetical protein DWQ02_16605 [Bacteroidota bacterium]
MDSQNNPCIPNLLVLVMNQLKSRKGNGTIACCEKAQSSETVVWSESHCKIRKVKAILPESQSPECYPPQRRINSRNVVPREKWYAINAIEERSGAIKRFWSGHRGLPSIGGIKGTNGIPKRIEPP